VEASLNEGVRVLVSVLEKGNLEFRRE